MFPRLACSRALIRVWSTAARRASNVLRVACRSRCAVDRLGNSAGQPLHRISVDARLADPLATRTLILVYRRVPVSVAAVASPGPVPGTYTSRGLPTRGRE